MRELSRGMRLLQPEDYRRMPWKNGLGITTEIAVSPMDAGLEAKSFDWRVSIANVEKDCRFSRFPGYDRSIMLIEGAGMELSFDSCPSQRIDQPQKPYRFKGESQTYCHLLDGLVRDFNVMSARGKFKHVCKVLTSTGSIHWKPNSETLLIYCLIGRCSLEGLRDKQIEINTEHTLILDKRSNYPVVKILTMAAFSKDTLMVIVKIRNL